MTRFESSSVQNDTFDANITIVVSYVITGHWMMKVADIYEIILNQSNERTSERMNEIEELNRELQ